MAKKTALGRGFDALIPQDLDVSILEEDKHRVQKIALTDIRPNADQPRRDFDASALSELTASVKQHGVLQPIIVVRTNDGYQIVAGERRWRAARDAKLSQIPAIVRSLAELERIELSLVENIQRVDLSPLEQALSVYRLQHQFNLTVEEIAKKLGKAASTVSNIGRLLQLPPDARQALASNKITEGHARAILALRGLPEQQRELLSSIINNGWTVRQAEQFVVAARQGASTQEAASHTASETDVTKRLSQKLNAPVKLKHMAHGGQLIISFKSEDDLNRIIQGL